jgi:hypothetical protein
MFEAGSAATISSATAIIQFFKAGAIKTATWGAALTTHFWAPTFLGYKNF